MNSIHNTLAALAICVGQAEPMLPKLKNNEVVVLSGVNWELQVANGKAVLDRSSAQMVRLDEFIVYGRSVRTDRAFWQENAEEVRRLQVTDRLSISDGNVRFDGKPVDCGGRRVSRRMGDAISLGTGVAVGVTLENEQVGGGFIYLLYFDAETRRAAILPVIGKMASLEFILFFK